ncbi:hypothetical protein [Desulfoscipio sp. XC116]|uniref:hypothetical protein n=1 Tax=Desulfoscipio sp. XC116 TaxID=3144975 RepID=UPI00325A53F7
MKTFDRLTRWMEKNLETPLYEAEMLRADLLKEEHSVDRYGGCKEHKKVIALRPAK